MTGYELDKFFNKSLGFFWQAQYSQIYSELDKMEKKGWLTSQRVVQEDKPNKRVYSITPEGKTEFRDWLLVPEADIRNSLNIRNAFLMRMFFAGETGKEHTLNLLHSFRDMCHARHIAYDGVKEEVAENDAYIKLTALYGEMMNQARLAWVEKAIIILETMEED